MEPYKLTLWERKGKKADGTEFTSYSNAAPFNGTECWWNVYKRTATLKDGSKVEVLDLVVKPKQAPSKEGTIPNNEAMPF